MKWREERYKQKLFLSLPTRTRHMSLRLLVDQSKSQKYFYLLFTYIPSTAYCAYKKNKGWRAKGRECIYVPLIMRKYCRHNSTYDTESSGRSCRSRTPGFQSLRQRLERPGTFRACVYMVLVVKRLKMLCILGLAVKALKMSVVLTTRIKGVL